MTDHPEARPATEDVAVASDAPSEPDSYVQGEAVTLLSVLDHFGGLGFTGQFDVRDGGVRCLHCRQESPATAVRLEELRRLEGASDPADMLAVAALGCPHCGALGTLVLNYGPESTPEDAEVLGALPEPG